MNKFLNTKSPKLVAMLSSAHADELILKIKTSIDEGAEGFCILTETLLPEYKNKETIRRIIDAMDGRQAYMTNYIRNNTQQELTDEVLAEQLLDMIDCGADLLDVRTDLFCRSESEVTYDTDADKKQRELIADIHKRGAEVLMSSHIFEYTPPERVLEIAKLQQSRGADIAKIVTFVSSQKELEDAFKTNALLNEKLSIPYLFLCNGPYCRTHRMIAPLLGTAFYLCLENSNTKGPQPTIAEAKMMIEKCYGGEKNE